MGLRAGLDAKSVKYHAGREKKTVVLFSGAAVGRGGKMLTFLFGIWQKADRQTV